MKLSKLADVLDAIGLEVSVPDTEITNWAGIHPDPNAEPLTWVRPMTFTITRKEPDNG